MDVYSHCSYTLLKPTALLQEALEHLLSLRTGEIPEQLRRELQERREEWKEEQDGGDGVEDVGVLVSKGVEFELIRRVHQQLEKTPMGRGQVYLHELLEGSELILPVIRPLKRDPELVARLERIKAQQEQKEYNKMVANVDASINKSMMFELGLEVQSTSRQLWAIVNFLLTVIGSFMFGYCAAYYSGFEIPGCVFVGLFLAVLVFLADLYFLVKNYEQETRVPKKSTKKPAKSRKLNEKKATVKS